MLVVFYHYQLVFLITFFFFVFFSWFYNRLIGLILRRLMSGKSFSLVVCIQGDEVSTNF